MPHRFGHAKPHLADAIELHHASLAIDLRAALVEGESRRHHCAKFLAPWPLGPASEEVAPRLVEVPQRLVERFARQLRQPGRIRRRLQLRELAAKRDRVELRAVGPPRFILAPKRPVPHEPPCAEQAQQLPFLRRLQAKPDAVRPFDGGGGCGHLTYGLRQFRDRATPQTHGVRQHVDSRRTSTSLACIAGLARTRSMTDTLRLTPAPAGSSMLLPS